MKLPPGFLMKIAKATDQTEAGSGTMSIIIRKNYAHLENEMRKTFKGQDDVKVIVDSREGERRSTQKPVASDRRKSDRRGPKEELIEVFIST
jgi:hypothetical protein